MKKFLNYVFYDWKKYEYILVGVFALIGISASVIYALPILPVVLATMILATSIYYFKNTLIGYIFTIVTMLFYSLYLYNLAFYSEIIGMGILILLVCYKIYLHLTKKETNHVPFDKWDYITLVSSLLIVFYPINLLLYNINSAFVVVGTISLSTIIVQIYLSIKDICIRKFIYLVVLTCEFIMFVLAIIQFNFGIIPIAVALLTIIVLYISNMVSHFKNRKKQ